MGPTSRDMLLTSGSQRCAFVRNDGVAVCTEIPQEKLIGKVLKSVGWILTASSFKENEFEKYPLKGCLDERLC